MTSQGLVFEPGRLAGLELRNRIVRSATAERLSDDRGVPGLRLLDMYRRLVDGGVGLIVTGHAYVASEGRCHAEMTAADRDELVPELARLADAVHSAGGRIALQINHGGVSCDPDVSAKRVGVSARAGDEGYRPLEAGEIGDVAERYGAAARRARDAGFDAVQVHGAHGYLVSQFLSPLTNRRDDEFGGELAGRAQFLGQVSKAIRSEVGPEYPVLIKLGVRDYSRGGLTLDDGLKVVAGLAAMGFDAVEVSHGVGAPKPSAHPAGRTPAEREAPFLEAARRARAVAGIPVVLVNGLRSRVGIDEVLTTGAADFVALCRPLICEPDLPERLRAGQEVAACLSCSRCWPKRVGEGVACRNPKLRGRQHSPVELD